MSKHRQGFLSGVRLPAWLIRIGINLWPPFIGMGIHVEHIAPDYRSARVRLKLRFTNRNYVGVHFGGSVFAMTDPFFMLLMMHNLGPQYSVWDKAARIEYKLPGRGTLHAHFTLTQAQIDDAIANTADDQKYLPWYSIDVLDTAGEVVATVDKQLYIRRKRRTPAEAAA